MKLSTHQISKIDPALKEVLEQSEGHEYLRTVMVLGSEKNANPSKKPDPGDFPNRIAYRKALILGQQQCHSEYLSGIRQGLANLALSVKGGTVSSAVVVEGTAGNILSSLELPEIQHASLDQSIPYEWINK